MPTRYHTEHIGCWIDGSVIGHAHLRYSLARMLDSHRDDEETWKDVIASLENEDKSAWPDDLSDEDKALEILQTLVIVDGLVWEFHEGDLVLADYRERNA